MSPHAEASDIHVMHSGRVARVIYHGSGQWTLERHGKVRAWIGRQGQGYIGQTIYGDTTRQRSLLRTAHALMGMSE